MARKRPDAPIKELEPVTGAYGKIAPHRQAFALRGYYRQRRHQFH